MPAISFVVYVCPSVCRRVTTVVIKLNGLNIKEYTVDYNCIYMVISYNIIIIYLTANGLSPGGSGYNACT